MVLHVVNILTPLQFTSNYQNIKHFSDFTCNIHPLCQASPSMPINTAFELLHIIPVPDILFTLKVFLVIHTLSADDMIISDITAHHPCIALSHEFQAHNLSHDHLLCFTQTHSKPLQCTTVITAYRLINKYTS